MCIYTSASNGLFLFAHRGGGGGGGGVDYKAVTGCLPATRPLTVEKLMVWALGGEVLVLLRGSLLLSVMKHLDSSAEEEEWRGRTKKMRIWV